MSLLPEINQASAEINKFVAQANIHQTIAPVNPAEFTSPADTQLLASRDPVIREVSVGMTGVEAVENTVSGTPPLSLPNSLGKPLKAWSVDVLPYQEGTGDPSPDNVRPIHGTDKLTITTAGKNLLDETEYSIASNHGFIGLFHLIGLEGSTVTLTIANGSSVGIMPKIALSYSGVAIWSDSTCASGATTSYTFVLTEAMTSAKLYCISTSTYTQASDEEIALCDIQLELGSTATPYTPYLAPSSSVITLPETIYSGTVYAGGAVSLMAKTVIDDSNTYNKTVTASNRLRVDITDIKPGSVAMCETFKYVLNSSAKAEFYVSPSQTRVFFNSPTETTFTTIEEWNAWLENNPISLVYELATPTTLTLTTPSIPTPRGNATTWATAEDGIVDSMEVTYYKSE